MTVEGIEEVVRALGCLTARVDREGAKVAAELKCLRDYVELMEEVLDAQCRTLGQRVSQLDVEVYGSSEYSTGARVVDLVAAVNERCDGLAGRLGEVEHSVRGVESSLDVRRQDRWGEMWAAVCQLRARVSALEEGREG